MQVYESCMHPCIDRMKCQNHVLCMHVMRCRWKKMCLPRECTGTFGDGRAFLHKTSNCSGTRRCYRPTRLHNTHSTSLISERAVRVLCRVRNATSWSARVRVLAPCGADMVPNRCRARPPAKATGRHATAIIQSSHHSACLNKADTRHLSLRSYDAVQLDFTPTHRRRQACHVALFWSLEVPQYGL